MTTARANQTTGLANGRAANWAPEVEFSPFRALSRRQMTFPFCCQISLVMNCQVGSYVDIRSPRLELSSSSIDHSADGRAYTSTGKLQSMYIWISLIYRSEKAGACLLPNTCLGLAAKLFAQFETIRVGISWKEVSEYPSPDENFNMVWVFCMLLAECAIFGTITW